MKAQRVLSAVGLALAVSLSVGCSAEPELEGVAYWADAYTLESITVSIDPWVEFDFDNSGPDLEAGIRVTGSSEPRIRGAQKDNTYEASWGPFEKPLSAYGLLNDGISVGLFDNDFIGFNVVDVCKLELYESDIDAGTGEIAISMVRDGEGRRCINEESSLSWADNSYRGNLMTLDIVLVPVDSEE